MMALTATATAKTRTNILKSIGLIRPFILSRTPNKPNISYCIKKKSSLEQDFRSVIEKVEMQRVRMARVIIYCSTQVECATLYELFRCRLGKGFTEPAGLPDLSQFRIVDMFTSSTHSSVKECIVRSFCKTDSRLRVVICTIAFGMGIDCPDVRQIIHWGPSKDIEGYMQESGRCGRDGRHSSAVLFYGKRDVCSVATSDEQMIKYCLNDSICRRKTLLGYFESDSDPDCSGCYCCDICAVNECECGSFPLEV